MLDKRLLLIAEALVRKILGEGLDIYGSGPCSSWTVGDQKMAPKFAYLCSRRKNVNISQSNLKKYPLGDVRHGNLNQIDIGSTYLHDPLL